jgi:hypothetical protein
MENGEMNKEIKGDKSMEKERKNRRRIRKERRNGLCI